MTDKDHAQQTEHRWLGWAVRLQALAQDGLLYAANPFDRDRYQAVSRIAAEIIHEAADTPLEHIEGLFSAQAGYATPKVDVRGLVFRDEQVLLVQELSDGLWTAPGGWADPGDTPSRAVEREIWEESGYVARAVRLLALYDRATQGHEPPHPFSVFKLFFLCELTGGAPAVSSETSGVNFFPVEALPPLSLGRVTARQIRHLYTLARNGGPTDFD
ncbi:MAG: NUDIX hydrolase [Anaerolineae bacterium]|jgi:ADP-ribose pyrophosphatase YjhB (NUDIX family)|nr:NUDIX hydrolase [Chloroflexota bacterium]